MTTRPYTPEERERALGRLFQFANRPRFRAAIGRAGHEFWEGCSDRDAEEVQALMGEMVEIYFHSWLGFDFEVKPGKTLVDILLAEQATGMSPGERAFLRLARESTVRPYDVERVDRDRGLSLRDLWTDEQVYVEERSATRSLGTHDVLAARIVEGPRGRPVLEGGLLQYPPHVGVHLLEVLRGRREEDPDLDEARFFKGAAPLCHDVWAHRVILVPSPTLLTPEGDRVAFVKARWSVSDPERVASTLDTAPEMEALESGGEWIWFEPLEKESRRILGNISLNGERLILQTMSMERAARGRRRIEDLCGGAVRFIAETVEDLDALRAREGGAPEDAASPEHAESSIPAEVRSRLRHEHMARHYRDWADTKLPALGGRTPRQALKSREGRERVRGLVRMMEQGEEEATRRGEEPFDFGWLREELGLGRESPGIFRYDPLWPPDPETWMARDEGERTLAIEDYHERAGDPLPNLRLHAVIHCVVENQIAAGVSPVRAALERLLAEGLDRHDAIHAIGMVLSKRMQGALRREIPEEGIEASYFAALDELSAKDWRGEGAG